MKLFRDEIDQFVVPWVYYTILLALTCSGIILVPYFNFYNTLFGWGSLMKVYHPKCIYEPYCFYCIIIIDKSMLTISYRYLHPLCHTSLTLSTVRTHRCEWYRYDIVGHFFILCFLYGMPFKPIYQTVCTNLFEFWTKKLSNSIQNM